MNNFLFFQLYSLAHQSNIFDNIVIFFGDIFPYIVVLMMGIFLLFHHEVISGKNSIRQMFVVFFKKWKEITIVFFSGIFAWLLAEIFKILIHSPRPFDAFSNIRSLFPEHGYAFPSQHATFFSAIAVAVFFVHKKAGYFFIVCALLIGLTRIIAGVHFPIDILGGFFFGSLVAYLMKKL